MIFDKCFWRIFSRPFECGRSPIQIYKVALPFFNGTQKTESQNFLDPVLAKPESFYKARF